MTEQQDHDHAHDHDHDPHPDLQPWRELARERAIPEPVIDQWLGLARPHLTLHQAQHDPADGPAPADAPIVGYRGGHPSLPADDEWDGEADFIAALDCAALPHDLPGLPLPADGQLLFFHTSQPSDFPGFDGYVQYIPAGTATAERVITTDHRAEALRRGLEPERFALQCWQFWDPPNLECHGEFISKDNFIELMPKGFLELMHDLRDPRPAYVRDNEAMVLGGYCHAESDTCGGAADCDPEKKEWRLLATFYREIHQGRDDLPYQVQWVIREADLAAGNFDQVKAYSTMLWA
jgi:hypothetical protein